MSKNLISQNPVQRFKLGKQIQKFQNAGKIIEYNGKKYQIFNNQGMHVAEIREKSNGKTSLYPINSNLEKTILNSNSPTKSKPSNTITDKDGTMYTRRHTWSMAQGYGPMKWYGPDGKEITKETTLQNGYILNPKNATYSHVSARKKAQQNIEVQNQDKISENISVDNTPKVVSPVVKRIDWGTEYQKALGNLTQTQKDYLTSLGANLSDVKSLQKVIGTKDDGKFGTNSNSALIAKLAEMPKDFGISNKPNTQYSEEVKQFVNNAMNQTQIDPYRAYDNYSRQALKNLGFNNYNTMVNYVLNNPQNQFSKDLTKRFGDVNTWNQADIEQNLGVYGNYRGSRTGDFGDIARSMSTWAGNFNGTQDGKVDLALRTGSDGIVYSNSRVKDLFDKYASKSLLSRNPVTRFKKGGFVNFRIAVQ